MPPCMKRDSVVVVGGINCDISASVSGRIIPGSSTPGRVGISAGGVGRNIAHGLALLGVPVFLVGRAGEDALSEWVLRETSVAGVDTAAVARVATGAPGMYVSLLRDGELEAAVADMTAIEGLSPEMARDLLGSVERRTRPAALVVDLNVPSETVEAVIRWANERSIPTVVEPVSVAKAPRLIGVSGHVEVVTPNVAEATTLQAAAAFLPRINWWVVTRGRLGAGLIHPVHGEDGGPPSGAGTKPEGTELSSGPVSPPAATTRSPEESRSVCDLLAARPVVTRNANGAGDALVAGLVAGLAAGLDVPAATRWGIAAGTITAASEGSVAGDLSREAVVRAAAELPRTGEREWMANT